MLSIQELWCKKLRPKGRGGLGYRYHKHFTGGAIGDDDWDSSQGSQIDPSTYDTYYDTYSIDSWIPESTVTGYDPYYDTYSIDSWIPESTVAGIDHYYLTPKERREERYTKKMRYIDNIIDELDIPEKLFKNIPDEMKNDMLEKLKIIDYVNKVFLDIRKEVNEDPNIKEKDAELGNRVEDYLDVNNDIFNILNPDNIGETKNSSNADMYYTQDAIDEIQDLNNKRKPDIEFLQRNLNKFIKDLEDAEKNKQSKEVINECKKKVLDATKILKVKSKPILDFFVTDYISDNNLFEVKTLKYKFSDYQKMTYVSSDKIKVKYNGKEPIVNGGINFVARKVTGDNTQFKPIFEKKNGSVVVKNVRFHYNMFKKPAEYVDTLKHEYDNYNAVFFLEDGIYLYDILKDDKLIIYEKGNAILDYPTIGDCYIIPTNKLVKVSASDLLTYNIPQFTAKNIIDV